MTEDLHAREESTEKEEGASEAIFSNDQVAEDAGVAADMESISELNVKRTREIPSSYKSPFVMRTVDVNSTLPNDANLICNWLFSLHEEPSDIVWINGKLSVPRVVLESLEAGEKMNLNIVDEDMRNETMGKAISLLFSCNNSPKLNNFNMVR
ncbi:hypothetical protein QQ045_019735 [Rhodiola kirilowii]